MSDAPAPPSEPKVLPAHLKLHFWPYGVVLDLVLRWCVLGLVRLGYIGSGWLWAIQILVIPFVMFTVLMVRESRTRKRFALHDKVPLQPEANIGIAVLVLVALAIGTAQTYAAIGVPWQWLRVVLTILAALVYLTFLSVVVVASGEVRAVVLDEDRDEAWTDGNDRLIIHLDSERASMQQRVDTYTLESALFGALAFSSFVTIVSSEKAKLTGAQLFIDDLARLFNAAVALSGDSVSAIVLEIAQETTLLAAIAAQTLICSALFLAVIVCRLRFNDLLARTDYCIRVAMQFNDKEEAVLGAVLHLDEVPQRATARLEQLRVNITESLGMAQQAMSGLKPVVNYMSLFRHLGVMAFLAILITSSVWISLTLAVLFVGLTATAFVYPLMDRWLRDRTLRHILQFQKRSRKLLPASLRRA
jgi:hypothetical protein